MVWPREQFVREVQSQLAGQEIHDPAKAPLPPYYPDTPIVRRTLARFYDCVTAMDKQVGEILRQLKQDGLEENTIVFFFSDHGSGMPRHKRVLLDSGIHVPLLIRFPEKYRHLATADPGETNDRLVSFVDFGPTVLSLTKNPADNYMQGSSFLGDATKAPRTHIYLHRDRIDEAFDCVRGVRDARYLYVRNLMPHLGHNEPSAWPEQGILHLEFERLSRSDKVNDAQQTFLNSTRPYEELYDCQTDPHNIRNLADSKDHAAILSRMRKQLQSEMTNSRDIGLLAESEAWKISRDSTLWHFGLHAQAQWQSVHDAAKNVGDGAESIFLHHLKHDDANVRYWGALGMIGIKNPSADALATLRARMKNDASASVRIAAADALSRAGLLDGVVSQLVRETQSENLTDVMHAARTLELLSAHNGSAGDAIGRVLNRVRPLENGIPKTMHGGGSELAMFIRFSCESILSQWKSGSN